MNRLLLISFFIFLSIQNYGCNPAAVLATGGGTTMVVDFCLPSPDQSLLSALMGWHNKSTKAVCDYSYHKAITSWSEQIFDEMK